MKIHKIDFPDGEHTTIEMFGDDIPLTRGVIAFLPALGVNIRYYRTLGEAWSQLGYRFFCMEMRGMGRSSVTNIKQQNFGYYEVLNTDIPAFIDFVAKELNGLPLFLAGHSLGAQFALLYAARSAYPVAGIILLAGGSNYYKSLPTWFARRKRQINFLVIRFIIHLVGFFPGNKLGFGGWQPRNMMFDWTEEGLNGNYCVISDSSDYNAAIEIFCRPVLFVSIFGDRFVPRSSADALAKKLKCAQVTQIEVQPQYQESAINSHFSWIKQPHTVVEKVEQWMCKLI